MSTDKKDEMGPWAEDPEDLFENDGREESVIEDNIRTETCPNCGGSGIDPLSDPNDLVDCYDCDGTGVIEYEEDYYNDDLFNDEDTN